jgi:hypothetical protein
MKKLTMLFISTILSLSFLHADEGEEGGKEGFLTSKWCVENDYFKDCRLETFMCGEGECYKKWEIGEKETEELVLYVHDEGKYYNIELGENLKRHELDHLAINKNKVKIIGEYDAERNLIVATEFKAPPPAKKSFFKGCL